MANNVSQIKSIDLRDASYPYLLKQIPDPPQKLYYRGTLTNFHWQNQQFLAIVGSRHPSFYGLKIAQEWSLALAKAGIVLVSGLALGIDTVVHQSALKVGASTIAVLGCAIDKVYPKQNQSLYQQIINHHGLVISEFKPNETISRLRFVTRNRIITGLCKAVLLIEGTSKSGTLATARYAGQQGREVLALPGRVNDSLAQAPLLMLKQGATLVLNPQEVIEAL